MAEDKATMQFRSEAQRKMFQRCVDDPDYAKSRGINPQMAREALDAHVAAGSPELPDRLGPVRDDSILGDG